MGAIRFDMVIEGETITKEECMKADYTLHSDYEGNTLMQDLSPNTGDNTVDCIEEKKDGLVIYKATIDLESDSLLERWNHVNNLLCLLEEEKAIMDNILNQKLEEKLKL